MSAWNALGEHRYRTQEELLLWVNGPAFSAAEIVELCSRAYDLTLQYGYSLLLVDCTRGGHVSAEGRKAVIDFHRNRAKRCIATAIIGASAPTRLIGQLITRAMALLGIQSPNQPFVFFSDEAAAHKWLAEQRQLFLSKGKESV